MTRTSSFFSWISRHRLMVVALGVVAFLSTSIALALYAESRHHAQVSQSAEVQAQILADSVAGALAFDDVDTINQYISALKANPDVLSVHIYNDRGDLLAQYESQTPARHGTLEIRKDVEQGGVQLGTLTYRQSADALSTRLARYGGAALLIILGTLMLAVMALDSRMLAQSNTRLREEMIERERAEAALRQSQKMEAVGRLTGGIAHDFNNMLAVIIGNLDLFMRRYPEADPKILRFVSSSQDAAKRAASLTHRLLAFSRRQPLAPVPADVGKSVQDMSDLLKQTLGESVSVETQRQSGLWRAHVDVGQLETAIVNLCVNARDAMPHGGNLTIATSNAYLDGTVSGGSDDVTPGEYVQVSVIDTGTGMSPDVIEQVFEPFFTTKPVGLGTGLGLSQVHGFVKQSGGHIAIESELGRGTTISLYLPRAVDDVAEPPVGLTLRAEHNRRDVTILVVDDDAAVRDFTSEALIELGYDVICAENAEEAMKVVDSGYPFKVLLTDVVMPGRNGSELAQEVHARAPDIKIIFMTGYTQNAVLTIGTLNINTQLITKPFTLEQLEAEMDRALRKKADTALTS